MAKMYKITPPIGNIVMPKEVMTEEEVREFFPQIISDPAVADVWKQKAVGDPIEELVEDLQRAGYQVEIIESK